MTEMKLHAVYKIIIEGIWSSSPHFSTTSDRTFSGTHFFTQVVNYGGLLYAVRAMSAYFLYNNQRNNLFHFNCIITCKYTYFISLYFFIGLINFFFVTGHMKSLSVRLCSTSSMSSSTLDFFSFNLCKISETCWLEFQSCLWCLVH